MRYYAILCGNCALLVYGRTQKKYWSNLKINPSSDPILTATKKIYTANSYDAKLAISFKVILRLMDGDKKYSTEFISGLWFLAPKKHFQSSQIIFKLGIPFLLVKI